MPTIKIHIGVPTFNQAVVEVFADPVVPAPAGPPAVPAPPPAAPAPVLVQKVVFNIVTPPPPAVPAAPAAPGLAVIVAPPDDRLEYVETIIATPEKPINPIVGEAYFEHDIADPAELAAVTTDVEWNAFINRLEYITPEHLNTHIPQRLLLANEAQYRSEAQDEAAKYAQDRDRGLPAKATPIITAIEGRAGTEATAATARQTELEKTLKKDGAGYQQKLKEENDKADKRENKRKAEIKDVIQRLTVGTPATPPVAPVVPPPPAPVVAPPVAPVVPPPPAPVVAPPAAPVVAPPAAPVVAPPPAPVALPVVPVAQPAAVALKIERLGRLVKTDEARLNAAVNETNNNIDSLTRAITIAQKNATEITTNDRNSLSATSHLAKLRTNYATVETNLNALERARVEINTLLVSATAYEQLADALDAGHVFAGNVPAAVGKDLEIIKSHVKRLTLLEYQLNRETRDQVQTKITDTETRLAVKERELANHNTGRAPLVGGRTPAILAKEIETDKTTLRYYRHKLDRLVPIDEAMPTLVEAKVRAEARVTEIAAQEAVAQTVFGNATTLLGELEASKITLGELRQSLKRAQKAFDEASDAHRRAQSTTNTDEAKTQLAKVEQARIEAKGVYHAIRAVETLVLQKLAEMPVSVVNELRNELNNAGNVEARSVAADALDKLDRTREEIRAELTRMLPNTNRYLNQSLDVDRLAIVVSAQAEYVKLKNDTTGLAHQIHHSPRYFENNIQTAKELLLDGALNQIKLAANAVKILAEEYDRQKVFNIVKANKAAADAVKEQKKAQKLLDDILLAKSAAEIVRIRNYFDSKQAELNGHLLALQNRQRLVTDPAKAAEIQALINTATTEHQAVGVAMVTAVDEFNRHKAEIERQARAAIATSTALLAPVNTARATSPSKWLDVWEESHNDESPLPEKFSPGRYSKAVRNVLERLLNPDEAEPTVDVLRAAADAALPPAAVIMGGDPAAIARAHAAVDDSPGLTNKDIIAAIESTYAALNQYSLVKQKEAPRRVEALKTLDFATRTTEKEKNALLATEERLGQKIQFSKHEIRNPDLPAIVPGAPPPAIPPGVPERIVDYIEQKFSTVEMFSKRTREATVRQHKNSIESNIVSEGALRTQVMDVVNRIGFPPNPADYPHADPAKRGKFPIHYDPALTRAQKDMIEDTVIRVFGELGFNRAVVEANVDFDTLQPLPVPAPRRRVR